MLTHLQLRDFVIVERAELDFEAGLTALTGETGAGKSIVVDALSMLAGGRAGADVIRAGAERAEATAIFTALPPRAAAWLEAQSIAHEDEVLLRRVVGLDGRSRAYVNGQLVPVQALRELGEALIEIHGQQEFQHLVRREAQREMLDRHGGLEALTEAVARIHGDYRECRRQVETLEAALIDRESRLELLRHEYAELGAELGARAASAPVAGTDPPVAGIDARAAGIEELFLERKRIAGRGKLADAARTALAALREAHGDGAGDGIGDGGPGRDNAARLLARSQAALRSAGDADPELTAVGSLIAEAAIQVGEAADMLRRFLDLLDVDPARQEDIERRAAALEALARKHRIPVRDLPRRHAEIETELASLEAAHTSSAEARRRLTQLDTEYRAAAGRLSAARRTAAADLGARIMTLMQSLGMAGGEFRVGVAPGDGEPAAHGLDSIEFLVSANPGQPPKSLAKVASGGELSRISLAVQVAAAAKNTAECMVFDEVDAGIGGAVAEIVGRQLRALGARAQVLCVTHLAQVASQAHSQLRVSKRSEGAKTRTTIERLGAAERVEEIARMLGGIDVTDQARAHAIEMLALAAPAKLKTRRSRGAE
jgi:DNA repair protein RecN (Recombination protein N)